MTHDPSIKDYLRALNEEDRRGAEHSESILAAPPDDWPRLLSEHPDWVRFGTFDALLRAANDELYREPLRALAITQLVVAHVDAVPSFAAEDFLLVQLRGNAFKELASALYTLERYDDAEIPARSAVDVLSAVPSLAVDRANAQFVLAQIWRRRNRATEALRMLEAAIRTYANYGDARHYLYAVEFLALIEYERENYAAAAELYTTAIAEAQRIHDLKAEARARNNRGECYVYLGDHLSATDDLSQAFTAFSTLEMDAAVADNIWTVARMARNRGVLHQARNAFERVYAEFLRLGMVARAMTVLVELSAVIAVLDGDLPGARLLCGHFVKALGAYPVEDSVRETANHLGTIAGAAQSAADFVAQVTPLSPHLRKGNSSARFVPPDSMTA